MLNKRDTVVIFRERLNTLIDRSAVNHARFAAEAGLDRSTLSQLLSDQNVRLPRAETIARIAGAHNVTIDWLLGLSQSETGSTDILRHLEITANERSEVDRLLNQWHLEAAGYKIRYVPMSLPDLLRTDAVIEYEFRQSTRITAEARKEDAEERLAYSRKPETDMEVCTSYQLLEGFAEGSGIWSELPAEARLEQLERFADLTHELYPTFRWFLYDGRGNFSVPFTIFGPARAAIYIGDMFFVFYSTEHIRVLTRRFDTLIREAVVQPNEMRGYFNDLIGTSGLATAARGNSG